MELNNSYIKLYRKIKDWEWYKDVSVKSLYIHLLISANFKDKFWQGKEIKRGQLIVGRYSLAESTGLTPQQVRTALKKLKKTNEITTQSTNKYTLITLVNYDSYQGGGTNEQPTINQQSTNNQPQLKNDKKEKKVINISTTTNKLKSNFSLIKSLSKELNKDEKFITDKIDVFIAFLIDTKKESHKNDNDLYKHFSNWIRKQSFTEEVNEDHFNWFINKFNEISGGNYKNSDDVRKLFAKQINNGFTGKEMEKAIRNLYNKNDIDSWHYKNRFIHATPEYLLKNDNLNKYLNLYGKRLRPKNYSIS